MRHTNFALENQLLSFEGGSSHIGETQSSSVRLHRSGDLVYHMYVLIDLPGIANVGTEQTVTFHNGAVSSYAEVVADAPEATLYRTLGDSLGAAVAATAGVVSWSNSQTTIDGAGVPYWTNAIGQYLVKEANVFIGSQPIDTLYADYLYMWEELTGKPGRKLLEMIGKQQTTALAQHRSKFFRRLYVPLPFFFTKTSGNALPLVSLQFHDVRVKISWHGVKTAICISSGIGNGTVTIVDSNATGNAQTARTVVRPGQASLNDPAFTHGSLARWGSGSNHQTSLPAAITDSDVIAQLEAQYVYLDVSERSRFAEGSFEMLMDEVQQLPTLTDQKVASVTLNLNFNHAVIEIFFAARQKLSEQNCDFFNFAGLTEPLTGAKLDPIKDVDLRLNNQCRFYKAEGRYFRLVQPYQHHTNIPTCFVYSYSFALHPEDAQPSGSCNFSRIDNAELRLGVDKFLFQDNSIQGGLNLGASKSGQEAAVSVTGGNSVSIICFARNWNVLRITLGLAGKAYAN